MQKRVRIKSVIKRTERVSVGIGTKRRRAITWSQFHGSFQFYSFHNGCCTFIKSFFCVDDCRWQSNPLSKKYVNKRTPMYREWIVNVRVDTNLCGDQCVLFIEQRNTANCAYKNKNKSNNNNNRNLKKKFDYCWTQFGSREYNGHGHGHGHINDRFQ